MANCPISVIILTFDSYSRKFGCIEHAVLSLLNQRDAPEEIVVVDNGEKKADQQKLRTFIDSLPTKDIALIKSRASIARARNIGANYARHDTLVFMDEDTLLLDKLALLKLRKVAKSAVHGYGAKRDWTKPEWFPKHAAQLKVELSQGSNDNLEDHVGPPNPMVRQKSTEKYLVRTFIGNFGFVSAEAFRKVKGFPEQFSGYGLEDDSLSFLLYHHFGRPNILGDVHVAHVTHSIRETQFEEYKKNLLRYQTLLKEYGYAAFHIGDLLYPEHPRDRAVLE
jgi:glycosyltransferase involved in cell wall biosynthesis